MLDPVALQAWRRRAQGEVDGARRCRSLKTAFAGAVGVVVVVTVLGGRALDAQQGVVTPPPPATMALPRCPAIASPLHTDVDGDGCDEEIDFADGVLTAGSVRLRVGAPGDQVAVGRWTCAAATVALLRPATGEVFRFDRWATQANAVSAVLLGRVEGAVGVHAAPRDGGRCDDVAVTRETGPPVLLPERPVAG
jgi:hypothetical protein